MSKSDFFKISNNSIVTLILVALVVGSLALAVFSYNSMPDKMTTHWDKNGNPNGYSSKTVGLFTFPALLGLFTCLFLLLPNIDPLKKNFKAFEKQFGTFMSLLTVFFIVIQLFVISWNNGVQVDINLIMPLAVGIILFYAGILMKYAKRNFFVGIRTPWTLSSDYVWNETHKLGSILFKIAGVLCVISGLFPEYTYIIVLVAAIGVSVISILYSYILFRKEEKKNPENKKSLKEIKLELRKEISSKKKVTKSSKK